MYIEQILNKLKVGQGYAAQFELEDTISDDLFAKEVQANSKRQKQEPKYEHVHAAAYATADIKWPPSPSEIVTVFEEKFLNILNPRPLELAFFIANKFPAVFQEEAVDNITWADLNLSMERM